MSLTAEGFTARRASEFLNVIYDTFTTETGIVIDREVASPLGNLFTIAADLLGQQSETTQALYDSRNLNNAQGVNLDDLAQLIGLSRTPAVASRVTLTVGTTLTTAVILPQGQVVEGGLNPDGTVARWTTTQDVTIPASSSISVEATSGFIGAASAGVGTITEIITPVFGWDSVTNADEARVGQNEETDTQLRARIGVSSQVTGRSTRGAILARLNAIEEVGAAIVVENPVAGPQVVQGLSLPANSYAVIVDPPGLEADVQQEIGQTIFDTGPIGIEIAAVASLPQITVQVTGLDGRPRDITFHESTQVGVDTEITVSLDAGFTLADVTPGVSEAVATYYAGLQVGSAVRITGLICAVAPVDGVVGVAVRIDPGTGFQTTDYIPASFERPVLGTLTVL